MRQFFIVVISFFTVLPGLSFACQPEYGSVYDLSQDWNKTDRDIWYDTSQGSRLLPMSWYRAVQMPGQDSYFAARHNQERYASLFCADSDLPIGFVVDETPGKPPALGLTCSACHTGVLHDGTRAFLVEGGASNLDLQAYSGDLYSAVLDTYVSQSRGDGTRWTGFAQRVLGDTHSAQQEEGLRQEVLAWLRHRGALQESVAQGGTWGPGRTDAVAVILNTAAVLSNPHDTLVLPPATAPTSFPHVWNAPQMHRVQWNGSAVKFKDIGVVQSMELGAVIRNIAEVIGVFAEIEIDDNAIGDPSTYPSLTSSTKLANLVELERSMESLKSPAWPEAAWGAIERNGALYQKGKALYDGQCRSCHSLLDRNDLTVAVGDMLPGREQVPEPFTRMVPAFDMTRYGDPALNTDPWMACNALTHSSWSGKFEKLDNSFDAFLRLTGDLDLAALYLEPFSKETVTLRLIEELALRMTFEKRSELMALQQRDLGQAAGTLLTRLKDGLFFRAPATASFEMSFNTLSSRQPLPREGTHNKKTLNAAWKTCTEFLHNAFFDTGHMSKPMYKARPLNGIFASAPYLHNGSVPTLDDLLRPTEARPQRFLMGDVVYDPVKLGLGAQALGEVISEFRVFDEAGALIPGNYNGGHEYPPSQTCATEPNSQSCAEDRKALLEYLKSL